ncbi:MAG: hypothetical protein LBT56_05090 [Prevotellaceae bacterium]|jgi:hypothetical protein|nr:hypothetical protein [Prevotellaceae bacterium]
MTELGEIYKKIDLLRASKTLDEIQSYLIASNYNEDSVKHAIMYVREKERNDLFVQKEMIDHYHPFLQIVKIYGCYLLAFFSGGYFLYYTMTLIRIFTKPFVIKKGNTTLDSLDKGSISFAMILVALVLLCASIGLFYLAHSMTEYKETIEKKIEEIKKRYTAPSSKQNESR